MKQSLQNWVEATKEKTVALPPGRMHVRFTEPCAAIVEHFGAEVMVGFGTDIKATYHGDASLVVPKGVRTFVYIPDDIKVELDETIFTNMDRKPMEGGHTSAVNAALRLFKIQQQQALAVMRAEFEERQKEAVEDDRNEENDDEEEQEETDGDESVEDETEEEQVEEV